jgi:putative transposase
MDFSGKQFPKVVIIMAVRWYLAYALSYRNIEELIKEWGIGVDHSTVQRWVVEYGSWLQAKVRKYLTRNFKRSWRLDETYIKVKGKWCYLYRIVDKDGDSIFCHFSETRDHQAALICVRGAIRIAGFIPDKINSDGSTANELAVKIINKEITASKHLANPEFCGPIKLTIVYTKVKYCNNILEQDHRRVKVITDPMKGFKDFNSAVSTIDGIEAIVMLRKNQCVFSEINGRVLSIADQINLIAA